IGYSILISYLLIGFVDWLQEKTKIKTRGLVVLMVYLIIILTVTLISIFIIPSLLEQIESLAAQLPNYFTKLQALLLSYNMKFTESDFPYTLDLSILSTELSKYLGNFGKTAVNQFVAIAFNTINFAVAALATIVLSMYFLIDGPKIWNGLMRPLSEKYLKHADILRDQLSRCLRGFFIGQIQLASLSGIYVFIVYSILGTRYALLLGIWQALIEIIPVVGGFIGIGLGMLVLVFNQEPLFGFPLAKSLIAFGVYMAYTQLVKDNVLTPRIMGDAIGLHPVVVILVVLIGAKLGGVNGVVFALPVAGLLNVLLNYYLQQRSLEEEEQKHHHKETVIITES
ncbi:MAG: AI-2E family transporter, partial [Candidatus Caenarcaniphilales bacterium]|nr:AI-2E family transporter [Candidatus Caenarcaniphilales bacterium]